MTMTISFESQHETSDLTGVATVPSAEREPPSRSPAIVGLMIGIRAMMQDFRLFARRFATRARARLLLAMICLAAVAMPLPSAADMVESGTVYIEQVQIAFIGSGNLGGGTLTVGGKKYNFSIGGLGIGGIGISKMECTGTVYNLNDINDFAGSYLQARSGIAVGSRSSGGLWLQNSRGVVLELRAKRTGLALSLGGDAVYIDFD